MNQPDFYTGHDFARAVVAHLGLDGRKVKADMPVATGTGVALTVTLTVMLEPDDLEGIGHHMRDDSPKAEQYEALHVDLADGARHTAKVPVEPAKTASPLELESAPSKTTAAKELDILVEEFINIPVLNPGRTRVDVMAEIQAVAERVTSEAPPKTSIGEFTVKLDTSQVQDAIREMLEPGAVYLPASAVAKVYSRTGASTRLMQECGAIVAVEVTPTTPFEDAVAAGRKVVHVDVPDADDKVRFAWVYEGGCSDAQRVRAISTETDAGRTKYAIPVDHLTAHQMQDAKIETM